MNSTIKEKAGPRQTRREKPMAPIHRDTQSYTGTQKSLLFDVTHIFYIKKF